jgi:hypothetical protein
LVAKKRPELFPEQCLEYAKQALDKAAGRKVYRVNALSAKGGKRPDSVKGDGPEMKMAR